MRNLVILLPDLRADALRTSTGNAPVSAKTTVSGIAALTTVLLSLAIATPAHSATFTHRAPDGTVTFSDAPISNGVVQRTSYKSQGSGSGKPINQPCKGMTTAQIDAKGKQLEPLFSKASSSTGVSSTLLKAVARAESCFDAAAQSHAGAQGLMQLMPDTARSLGVTDSFNIEQNIDGGARFLATMLERYSNNLDLALAAYNAGPGNVDQYNGVPPFDETRQYIVNVKNFAAKYTRPESATLQVAASEE